MSLEADIFEFRDYKAYLLAVLERSPRGTRKAMANAAQCQTAYISHVLNGQAHLSLEQAEALSRFVGHGRKEARFFLLLVEFTRAGTASLRKLLSEQLDDMRGANLSIKERVGVKETLSREDQATYYSAWYYAAIHVLTTLPHARTKEAIARFLDLPLQKVAEIADFLLSVGLVESGENGFRIGKSQIHLEKDSPLISKHHANWRIQALRSLDHARAEDLHFSSVFTISKTDREKIRTILVQSLESSVNLIKTSKEERICAMTLDFFDL